MNKNKSILLLDDHTLFLYGIKHLLREKYKDYNFHSYTSVKQLINEVSSFDKFDLFISDLDVPGENVQEFLKKLREISDIPILIVSSHNKVVAIKNCQEIGVNGYILKNDEDFLIPAAEELLKGKEFYSPSVKKLLNGLVAQNLIISDREKEVIRFMCEGVSNQYIADKLGVSVETIKSHKRNVKSKLGLETTPDIIKFAKENMLI